MQQTGTTKIMAQLNSEGYFAGMTVADESPLEPGVFHEPFGAIDAPDPQLESGKRAKWTGTEWFIDDIPPPPPPEEPVLERELTYAELRVAEYPRMAEYLDGIVKGDQAQIDAYIAACLAVKLKYPKPV